MSNGESWFMGFVPGCFLGALITLIVTTNMINGSWQKAAVAHKAAKFVATERDGVVFKWKDEVKGD